MANLYVTSTGSNTAPYDTWAKAATNPSTAVNAAAAGDTVYIHGESFTIAANETWTLAGTATNPVRVVCSNDKVNEPPQTLGTAKYTQTTTGNDLVINGIGYINGFTLESTSTASLAITLTLASTDADELVMENCGYVLSSTNNGSTSGIIIGAGAENNSRVRLINPTIVFGNATGQGFTINQNLVIEGGSISMVAAPTSLFRYIGRSAQLSLDGCDISGVTSGTMINPGSQTVGNVYELRNFRHHAAVTLVGAYTDVSQPEVYLSNYGSGDTHYNFAHYSSRGSTIMETGIYANDGQTYNGTNHITWKIVTTGYASQAMPYVSPWIEKYHSGTSAITPYFEILRDGSTTPYTNAEVWGEFSYQGTSGYPKANFSNDESVWLAGATNQDAGIGTSGWTGDTGAWSGKIDSGSTIMPAEIGMLRGRICVGAASSTVYLDPKIRT